MTLEYLDSVVDSHMFVLAAGWLPDVEAYPGVFGPVETFWSGVQEIQIRPASTERWNREDAPSDLIDCPDAQTSSLSRGGI